MRILLILLMLFGYSNPIFAQDLTVATVTRAPFSMPGGDGDTGFSLDLWAAVAKDLGKSYKIIRVEEFGEMLELVQSGKADVAVANISITSEREKILDFSQPIFASGLQIMAPSGGSSGVSILSIIFSKSLMKMLVVSLLLLFGAGMLMWLFERKSQPYFEQPAGKIAFPAFWWALNLVVNGGFEERPPMTMPGRIFGVILVISSLFIVSFFVANVTATLTVSAIQNNVSTLSDLYGKEIGTIEGSTASRFIDSRDLKYQKYSDLDSMLQGFEVGNLDAIVFDAPVLAYYANQSGSNAEMIGPMFHKENYGFALPTGSQLLEPINRSLLRLKEEGVYEDIYRDWFGNTGNL